jgi:hypothetical protein
LIGFGLFELALIIERWAWTRLIQIVWFWIGSHADYDKLV